jgi:AraC-like DNA-binding protein
MPPEGDSSRAAAVGDTPPSRFSFSTDWLPERDRLDFFKGEVARFLGVDVEPLDERPRHVMQAIQAGPIVFSEAWISTMRFTRRPDHLKDQDEGFALLLMVGGCQHLTHNGQELALRPGDATLIHNGRPGVGFWPKGGATVAVRVDGTALRALVRHPEQMAGVLVDRSQPGLALLKGYLKAFTLVRETLSPDLAQSFGHHVVDLVAAVLGATRDGAAQAEAGGVRAARRQQVLDAIARRACDPSFTVDTLAGELGVTSRYVQRLLEETGSTFSARVTERRLVRARHLLGSGDGRRTVAEIALEAGFNDLAHFHRVFRRRFGTTPAAMRGVHSPG